MFYFGGLLFMYYLCEKYDKPITAQYYIADCVSWVPRLTFASPILKLPPGGKNDVVFLQKMRFHATYLLFD